MNRRIAETTALRRREIEARYAAAEVDVRGVVQRVRPQVGAPVEVDVHALRHAHADPGIDPGADAPSDESAAAQTLARKLIALGYDLPKHGGDTRGWKRLLVWRDNLARGLMPADMREMLTETVIDGSAYAAAKTAALRAHATQVEVAPDTPYFALSNDLAQPVFTTEYYELVHGVPGGAPETDLFEGLGL